MKYIPKFQVFALLLILAFYSCESEEEKKRRIAFELQKKIELEAKQKKFNDSIAIVEEEARIAREKREDKMRIAKQLRAETQRLAREAEEERKREARESYKKYINNSLRTGATPYAYCFGKNNSCSGYGCSQITVKTPYNSDVVVTIKKNDKVFRHAYIDGGSSYTFTLPDGAYQPFFYYGKGWNPDKVMKETNCGKLKGGFVTDEHFGKDGPQVLSNQILQYKLILQRNGNFSTRPSNAEEAF